MKAAAKTILYGQAFLYAGLFVCTLLKPAGLGANDGISYYGIYRQTFFPYAVGLLGAAYFTVRAMGQLPEHEKVLRLSLKIYVPLIVGIVITPYAAGRWMDYLHTACGSALFSLQLILSGYLVWRLRYAWWSAALSLVELGAGILSLIWLNPTHGLLFQSQTLFQLAFGALLILALQTLPVSNYTKLLL
jgi:hypothetical protein